MASSAVKKIMDVGAYHARSTGIQVSHQQRVTRLYRRALRTAFNWGTRSGIGSASRTWSLVVSHRIRQAFDMHADLSETHPDTEALVRQAEDHLHTMTHPDAYQYIYMPGGSAFMRNPSMPLESVFPDGVPPEVDIAPQTVEAVQVAEPSTDKPYGPNETVLIDHYRKSAI